MSWVRPLQCSSAHHTINRPHPPCSPQDFEPFLDALTPVLARLSYAFSCLVLVCQGSPGFQAQVRPCEGTGCTAYSRCCWLCELR